MSQRFRDVSATFVDQFAELHRVGYRAAYAVLGRRSDAEEALRYLTDLPENQTASAMGCSLGAVKSNTAKGLQRLRLDLGPRWAWED